MPTSASKNYSSFLKKKQITVAPAGFVLDPAAVATHLYPFQRHIVQWAIGRGRAALFADCGLGKTPMQIEWARLVREHTNKPVLLLAPLAVAEQTQREGTEKFGVPITLCRTQADAKPGLNITNYEMLHHFDPRGWGGIVLDESSILKNYSGHFRVLLTQFASSIPYRLACTATPAPNDLIEIINHAEFLGVMNGKEIIALFFRQDGNTTHSWRLKGHAQDHFWRWMASWAVAVRRPSDLGFDDTGFGLPALNVVQHTVEGGIAEGFLFPVEAHSLQERRQARRASLDERVEQAARLANSTSEPFLLWCDLNDESAALTRAITGAVEVKGSDSPAHRVDAMMGFTQGRYRALVSKPSICGFGMNWQHCNQMAFVGLSDSWESFYQAVRRCWRFGQTRDVNAHVVVADTEGAVVANIQRKEAQAAEMMANMVKHMGEAMQVRSNDEINHAGRVRASVPAWLAGRTVANG